MTPAPSRHYIDLAAGRRHYIRLGDRGPPVLFIHGFTDSWRSFELLFEALASRFRLFALDQRGHGGSDPASRYTIADFAGDAIAFIESLGEGKVHLVGHSLGSIVALRAAEQRPDLVASLVLIGAATSAGGHAGVAEMRADLAGFAGAVPRDYVAAFQASTAAGPLAPEQLEIFVAESMKLSLETWRGVLAGLLDDPGPGDAPIEVPTLILWGEKDGVFDAAAQAVLRRKIPAARVIDYPEVGHAPHWEIPARVAGDIERFLLAQPAEAPAQP
jgi:pimeloyl-ACP methyl ester carboxylesterase